ncbi:mechanosensitive ion channel domain-containing protein [Halolamina salina]|uniref:Mechanosensitive ion channel domain-containing protein n=1 Tax=Halolamina salina TaxID=1220023 RepID=A0ABD6B3V5_9EURY
MLSLQFGVVQEGIDRFIEGIAGAIPRVLSGIVFILIAAVLAKVVMTIVRVALRRTLPKESDVYRQFVSTIVAAFLWFGIGLSFLSIVGLDQIAASMGTAAGFLALGVSYSLSSMIADAVAGVYLLRDPDFMPGDRVKVGEVSGTVTSIELRKTRFRDENDDTVVRGNAEIEKKWTKLKQADDEATGESDGEATGEFDDEAAAESDDEAAEESDDETA